MITRDYPPYIKKNTNPLGREQGAPYHDQQRRLNSKVPSTSWHFHFKVYSIARRGSASHVCLYTHSLWSFSENRTFILLCYLLVNKAVCENCSAIANFFHIQIKEATTMQSLATCRRLKRRLKRMGSVLPHKLTHTVKMASLTLELGSFIILCFHLISRRVFDKEVAI